MAKPLIFGKRENEKKKQARRIEKQNRKEEKKLSGKVNRFEDMIAYVDKHGRITSTPPEMEGPQEEINEEEIRISTPKKEEVVLLKGRIEHLNSLKGFGFIKNLSGTDKYFFHISRVVDDIVENDIVTFDLERGKRGMNAINICVFEESGH